MSVYKLYGFIVFRLILHFSIYKAEDPYDFDSHGTYFQNV